MSVQSAVVAVFCDDRSHRDAVNFIDVFRRADDPDTGVTTWIGDMAKYTTHSVATESHQSTYSARIDDDGSSYAVYRLHCNKCPRPRSVPGRRNRFFRVLDTLNEVGRNDVSLRDLSTMLSKQ